jgi:hypothetical protein
VRRHQSCEHNRVSKNWKRQPDEGARDSNDRKRRGAAAESCGFTSRGQC